MRFFTAALALGLAMGSTAKADVDGIFDVSIGKTCWVTGFTNTAAIWTVAFTNNGEPGVVLHGSGADFIPMNAIQGNTRFVVNGALSATFSAVYEQDLDVRVKFGNLQIATDAGDPALFHTIVGGEDGDDDDWQDLVLNVTCLHRSG